MAIQIFELIVKMSLEDKQFKDRKYKDSFDYTLQEQLVSNCVEEVLRRLQYMNER